MPKKPGLTLDEHTELGAELAAMRERLGKITVQLSHAYPNPVAGLAVRAQADLDRLRSKLDEMVFREHPGLSTKSNSKVYYPGRSRKSSSL
jgi:hypothetical protein